MSTIELVHLRKDYGKENVIPDLNLKIEDKSFTVLVGPSGCGKSTTLRMIAGLERPTDGQILIDGNDVAHVPSGKRDVSMVFQNYALYPTMTIRKNIEFGLINKHVPKAERDRLIGDVCEIVGLTPYLDRKPGNLSGGQRQRVALARAMVKKPKVFLMDEPLSNLDAKLRASMRIQLIELHKRLQTTFIYVTHDQIEAMSMGSAIVLMDKGIIMQQSTPRDIYHNPQNVFTAQFIGTPPMNVLSGLAESISIGFRPEKVRFEAPADDFLQLPGIIATKEQLGAEVNYSVNTSFGKIAIRSEYDIEGTDVKLFIKAKNLYAFDNKGNRIEMTDKLLQQIGVGR